MKNNEPLPTSVGLASARMRKWRFIKDKLAKWLITIGGMGAIGAISLIFIYLLSEVIPLFESASIRELAHYNLPLGSNETVDQKASTLYLSIEEQAEVGLRITSKAEAVFFNVADGSVLQNTALPLPPGVSISAVASDSPEKRLLVLGLSDGRALVIKHDYAVSYPNNKRVITPTINYPYGQEPLQLSDGASVPVCLAIRDSESALLLIAADSQHNIHVNRYAKESNMLTEQTTLTRQTSSLPQLYNDLEALLINDTQRWLFVVNGSRYVDIYNLQSSTPVLHNRATVVDDGTISQAQLLLGGNSLLVSDNKGNTAQWTMVKDEQNTLQLTKIREFATKENGSILNLTTEQRRKGFLTVNAKGTLNLYNTTAQRNVLTQHISDEPILASALSPRANVLLTATEKQLNVFDIKNPHPDVSWSSLWQKVWYEGYDKPKYVWQSSASNSDFEPKFSLMPLAFGTLKAAFYAMILATPLSICAAMYTAYFMAPRLRRKVKPAIELMAALPTVILGFLAGLWLAPYVEKHLMGILNLLFFIPLGVFLFSYAWFKAPAKIRDIVSEGWDAIVLVPVILLLGWFALAVSIPIEQLLFAGDLRGWLSNSLGIHYDQRNALVVGLAMGFAVVPSVFSIAEDAIFSVPKQLSYGSLALGATPWQTLVRVVLLTASPGIFSGVMIGMGRAVGETMIVLMSTGNTPIMDASMFDGMRTLSANIAVEMPESEVGSTHYRILFLAALVLFLFTFVVNTLAEVVRQRLRKRYESL